MGFDRFTILFRWALWKPSVDSVRMLSHSIGTFRYWFGERPTYLVYADAPAFVSKHLLVPALVLPMAGADAEYVDDRATWLKWTPRFRHDVSATEIHVDSDIFLVSEPTELYKFVDGYEADFVVTLEEFTELWPYGNFGPRLPADFVPINAGFFGQRAGTDLSDQMRSAYRWWADFVASNNVKYHDEQGALAFVLQELIRSGRVMTLPSSRYRVVCPLNDPPVESLDGLVGLHATYPEHPAYHRFLTEISKVSGVPLS